MKRLLIMVVIITAVLLVFYGCYYLFLEYQISEAEKFITANDFSSAQKILLRHHERAPESARINYLLGICYLYSGKIESASIYFQESIHLDSTMSVETVSMYLKRAKEVVREKRISEACDCMIRAFRIDSHCLKDISEICLENEGILTTSANIGVFKEFMLNIVAYLVGGDVELLEEPAEKSLTKDPDSDEVRTKGFGLLDNFMESKLGVTFSGIKNFMTTAVVKYTRERALQGIAQDQFLYGTALINGFGIEKDYQQALRFLSMAAEQGHREAMMYVGRIYIDGLGIEKDPERGFLWFEKSAQAGHPKAMYLTAALYHDGIGVKTDYEMVCFWLEKAAKAGDIQAQFFLGVSLFEGSYCTKDEKEGISYLQKAANGQYNDAIFYLGNIYFIRKEYQKAHSYIYTSAIAGNATSQYYLSQMYYNGLYFQQNNSSAIKWARLAAEQNHVDAQYNLGYFYHIGIHGAVDNKEAFNWFQKAAQQNHAVAQKMIGIYYWNGLMGEPSSKDAAKWFVRAVKNGNNDSLVYLGSMFIKGDPFKKCVKCGFLFDLMAAQFDNPLGLNSLAWILATSPVSEIRNGKLAIEYAKKAVSLEKTWIFMDTLAAAYAEAGDFERAIKTQKEVLTQIEDKKNIEMASARLQSYEDHKQWRE